MHRESLEVTYKVVFMMTEGERRLLYGVFDDWLRFRGSGAGDGLVEIAEKFQHLLHGMVPLDQTVAIKRTTEGKG